MRTCLNVHGATMRFETNAKPHYDEFLKEFGLHASDKSNEIDGTIRLSETDEVDFEVPEGAIRDSIVFPSASMYVHRSKIFLLEKGKYFITIDPTKFEVDAHVKPSCRIFEKIRFITKKTLVRLLENKGIISIHGSAATDDDGALLFTGMSGSGKTTSLIALLERGYRMLTDDAVLIDEEAVLPFYLRSMIHRDTLERFPSLASGITKTNILIQEADGWWINLGHLFPLQQEPSTPRAIFHTQIWNSIKSSYRKIEPSKMLSNLIKNYMTETSVIFKPTAHQLKQVFSAYSKLVEQKPCYNLYIGRDPERLFRAIEEASK
jgi:hypothetical protein